MDTDSIYKDYIDPDYLSFAQKLSKTDTIARAGIRIPILRKLAKDVSFDEVDIKYHEDVILKGLSLAFEKNLFEKKIDRLNSLLPYLSSWDQTDTIQSGYKPKNKDREQMISYFADLLDSKSVFPKRFGIVWIICNRKEIGLDKAINLIVKADDETEYYISMAVAWALSIFYFDDAAKTISKLDYVSKTTKQRTLQKIRESKRYKGEELPK